MKKQIKVKPNSSQQKITEMPDGSLIIHLKSPPVDGKANAELISILAEKYHITKSQVTIKSGLNARQKLVELEIE